MAVVVQVVMARDIKLLLVEVEVLVVLMRDVTTAILLDAVLQELLLVDLMEAEAVPQKKMGLHTLLQELPVEVLFVSCGLETQEHSHQLA
jgi:hypothetical protein